MKIFGTTKPSSPRLWLGSSLILAGISIISPGVKDLLLAYADKVIGLGLQQNVPWWAGLVLIGAGLVIISSGPKRLSDQNRKVLIAIRHQSFEALSRRLEHEDVPRRLRDREIVHFDLDQSSFFRGDAVNPVGAVQQQLALVTKLEGLVANSPDTVIGYYGISHIPLHFLAGCSISTKPKVALFELCRSSGNWVELSEKRGTDLSLSVSRDGSFRGCSNVSMRISVSYEITVQDVEQILPVPLAQLRIGLDAPALDAIKTYRQVEQACTLFRKALDEVSAEADAAAIIHIFYAGPVSLGFSLGRWISKSIHPKVVVYNYTSKSRPRYSWGIEVTSNGPPEAMLVRPQI